MHKELNPDIIFAQRLKSGDTKAYDSLMDSYYRCLCIYAYGLTKDHATAEDIVQNVFVAVWTKRKHINPLLSIKSYLYRAVHNEFIDQYRKNQPVIYLEKKYLEALDYVLEDEKVNLEELTMLVNKEIEKLPNKCKRIFLMNKKEGLTHLEIAKHLDISIKTVEGHITRAFKILEEKLQRKVRPVFFLLYNGVI